MANVSIQKFNAGILAGLQKEAKEDFNIKIKTAKALVTTVSPSFSIAIAPIISKKTDMKRFAFVKIFSTESKKKALMPGGTFILGREGKKSFLIDDKQNVVVTGNVHAAPRSIRVDVGGVVITIGNGKICIYWDDPTDGGPFSDPKCHCHCFVYAIAS
ncbi:MAG: hypothetical protein QM737_05145 [Ferruginibacter sp.]